MYIICLFSKETPLQISINGAGRQLVGHGTELPIVATVVDVDETNEDIRYYWYCKQVGEVFEPAENSAVIVLPTNSGRITQWIY